MTLKAMVCLAVLLAAACKAPGSNSAGSGESAIPDETIVSLPDTAFRNILKYRYQIMPDENGNIVYGQVKNIKYLRLNMLSAAEMPEPDTAKIADFTGIGLFTALEELEMSYQGAADAAEETVWDFSQNKNLRKLALVFSDFPGKINVGSLPKLEELYVAGFEKLSGFSAGSLPVLERLDIKNSASILGSIKFSQMPALQRLYAAGAFKGVKTIDLSPLASLIQFQVQYEDKSWDEARQDLEIAYVSKDQEAQLQAGGLSEWINLKDFEENGYYASEGPAAFNISYQAKMPKR